MVVPPRAPALRGRKQSSTRDDDVSAGDSAPRARAQALRSELPDRSGRDSTDRRGARAAAFGQRPRDRARPRRADGSAARSRSGDRGHRDRSRPGRRPARPLSRGSAAPDRTATSSTSRSTTWRRRRRSSSRATCPYNISKPVAMKLVVERRAVRRAVLMFQREVADRLTASPGDRAYGPLTVLAGLAYRIERLFDLRAGRVPARVRTSSPP